MPTPSGRIRAGEPIGQAISANAYNRALDAADWVHANKSGKLSGGTSGWSAPYTRVAAVCTVAVPRWGIVRISGIGTDPSVATDYPEQSRGFEVMPCLAVSPPVSDSEQIAVALEPLVADQVGWVAVAGVVQVKLNIFSAADSAAVPIGGSVERLQTGSSGYPLLWKEPGTGSDKWGLLLLARGGVATQLATFSGAWPAGQTKTIRLHHSNQEVLATNLFCAVGESCGSNRFCVVFQERGLWYLIAAHCGAQQ